MFSARLAEDEMDLRSFVSSVDDCIPREPGTAVFLTSNRENVPHAMLHRLNHCKALHERLVLVSGGALPVIVTADIEGAIGLTFVPTGRFLRERPRRADAGRVSLHLANVESRRGSSLQLAEKMLPFVVDLSCRGINPIRGANRADLAAIEGVSP